MIAAVELAVDDMNQSGGVLGNQVALTPGDEAGDAAIAEEAADSLIAEGVNALIGAGATAMTRAIVRVVTGADVLQCSASNTAPGLRSEQLNGLYFRTATNDALQGVFAADVLREHGHRRIVVAASDDQYSTDLLEAITERLERTDVEIADTVIFEVEATDLRGAIERIVRADADALYLIAHDEGALILEGLVDAGLRPRQFPTYGSDRLRSDRLAELVGGENPSVLEGMRGTAGVPPPMQSTVADRLRLESGIDDVTNAAEAYDCAIIIGLAAELAGTAFGPAMALHLEDVTTNGTPCDSFADCKALIEAGEDIAYQTASGIVLERTESGNHEPDAAMYELWEINARGQVETVSTRSVRF
jgi:branched-chain amino acid transport system substrate-binding protein